MILKKVEDIFKKIIQVPVVKPFTQTQFALKSAEVIHRLTYAKRYNRMAEAMERFKKCMDKKPKSQIKKEMSLCKNFWSCYPLHYYRYDLYRKDKKLSDEQLINYIPEFFFYYLYLPFHNLKTNEHLLANKNRIEQLFRDIGIPQAHTICKVINNQIYTKDLKEISFNNIEKELTEEEYQKIFIKPADGQGGHGIYIFCRNDTGQYITKSGVRLNNEFLCTIGIKNDWIIQSGIEQDPEISKIYPSSINTFRIITENKNSLTRVICSELRIGRDGKEMDNFCQGGLVVKINIETGKLDDYALSEKNEFFQKHPNTNFVFKDYKILNWDSIKEFAIKSAKKIPQFTYLGWDITLTKTGPIVLETHANFGLDGIQSVTGGLRDILQINDPQFYWRNKGKRI